jgi:hypothetical protein
LLPLPTGAKNLQRLRRLYRYDVYRRYYESSPATEPYLARIQALMATNPRWFDEELAKLTAELSTATHYVYGSRDQRYLLDAIPALLAEADDAVSVPGQSADVETKAPDAASTTAPEAKPLVTAPRAEAKLPQIVVKPEPETKLAVAAKAEPEPLPEAAAGRK